MHNCGVCYLKENGGGNVNGKVMTRGNADTHDIPIIILYSGSDYQRLRVTETYIEEAVGS